MEKLLLLCGLVVLLMASCLPVTLTMIHDIDKLEKAMADKILIVEDESNEPYKILESVEVENTWYGWFGSKTDYEKVKANLDSLLREKAVDIGGDAVINVKYEEFDGGTKATGDVVVFK